MSTDPWEEYNAYLRTHFAERLAAGKANDHLVDPAWVTERDRSGEVVILEPGPRPPGGDAA